MPLPEHEKAATAPPWFPESAGPAVNYTYEYKAVFAESLPARPGSAKANGHQVGTHVLRHRGNPGRVQATQNGRQIL